VGVSSQIQRSDPPSPPPRPNAAISVRLVFASAVAAAVLMCLLVAWLLVDPAPPGKIRLATGPEGGFYEMLGERYRRALRSYGLEILLVPTAGTPENLVLLREGTVDVAFVQGGVGGTPPSDTSLRSLASLDIEPLWLFSRHDWTLTDFLSQPELTIAGGRVGSGTRDLVDRLLRYLGVPETASVLELEGREAVAAVLRGEVDVAAFVTAPSTPWVDQLLRNPDVAVVEPEFFDAIVRHFPFAYRVELPQRVIDYGANVPDRSLSILGVSTSLVVTQRLHPAVKQVLLQVSKQVARGNRLLGTYGQFPSTDYVEYPLDAEAERFFSFGPTILRRYLPFWAANLFERFWVLVIPIATLVIPILRFGPTTVQWGIRRRIYRHYRQLRELEAAAEAAVNDRQQQEALEALDRVEADIREIVVPLAFRDDLYRLRTHVAFVRAQLTERST
jgi:TRAP-type uncharacterized transport system substrate-binding protein